jgi:hypothetical protein
MVLKAIRLGFEGGDQYRKNFLKRMVVSTLLWNTAVVVIFKKNLMKKIQFHNLFAFFSTIFFS